MTQRWLESWIGRVSSLLPEEIVNGHWEGYTPEYIRVRLEGNNTCESGKAVSVRLTGIESQRMKATLLNRI